eukprot:1483187-Lingulodinium_polyedra.AAC.1
MLIALQHAYRVATRVSQRLHVFESCMRVMRRACRVATCDAHRVAARISKRAHVAEIAHARAACDAVRWCRCMFAIAHVAG